VLVSCYKHRNDDLTRRSTGAKAVAAHTQRRRMPYQDNQLWLFINLTRV
jgi:hypothetical protein